MLPVRGSQVRHVQDARGDKAIEWQPLANPGMRRLCACPTCGGKTGLQKCNNCVGLGYA